MTQHTQGRFIAPMLRTGEITKGFKKAGCVSPGFFSSIRFIGSALLLFGNQLLKSAGLILDMNSLNF